MMVFIFFVLVAARTSICEVFCLELVTTNAFNFAILDGATEEQLQEFSDEIQLMKQIGYHQNILNLLTCCTMTNPMFLVVEFAKNGDLLQYLRKRREQVK